MSLACWLADPDNPLTARVAVNHDIYSETELHFERLLLEAYRVLVLNTHPEYWSAPMYQRLKQWVHHEGDQLLYLAGCEMYAEVEFADEQTILCRREGEHTQRGESEACLLGLAYTHSGFQSGAGGGQTVRTDDMSSGTCDQLYLALRLALLESYLDRQDPLPFIVDDILVMFDDDRREAVGEGKGPRSQARQSSETRGATGRRRIPRNRVCRQESAWLKPRLFLHRNYNRSVLRFGAHCRRTPRCSRPRGSIRAIVAISKHEGMKDVESTSGEKVHVVARTSSGLW